MGVDEYLLDDRSRLSFQTMVPTLVFSIKSYENFRFMKQYLKWFDKDLVSFSFMLKRTELLPVDKLHLFRLHSVERATNLWYPEM